MWAHLDQFASLQKFIAIHDQLFFFRVNLLIDIVPSIQDPLFFFRDHRQCPKQFLIHLYTPAICAISFASSIYSAALRLLFLYAMIGV